MEALLQAYEDAGSSFLKGPLLPLAATGPYQPGADTLGQSSGAQPDTVDQLPRTDLPQGSEGSGSQIGPYRLVEKLGEGGMGVVWMAEQERPIRRQVALKIIKPGMDSAHVIARFETERQALTMMDHDNIARVYDAGTTALGRPYFVMELVKGTPLTRFCNDNALTLRERLELFVPVCQAIQHAHQKGVIHRDIKPSNVLVALQDDRPVAKVIDFGLAKATEQPLTEHSELTEFGAIAGTLEYMSPEQAHPDAQGIDTRTDVYSLGVTLYELLTGTTPLDRAGRRGADRADLLRRIEEEEPPKPSARVAGLGDRLTEIAKQRKTEPVRLVKLLRGELDWIVLRALAKERERRYDTASGFGQDVQRYLDDERVEACPPTRRYRLGKLWRKHRTLLVTAAGFVALLVLGVAGLAAGLVVANSALRQEANERQKAVMAASVTREALVVTLAQNRLSLQNRTRLGEKEQASLRKMLQTYRQLVAEPGASLELRSRAAQTEWYVAGFFARIGSRNDAEAGYRSAIEQYQALAAELQDDAGYRCRNELGRCYFDLAGLFNEQGNRAEAIDAYRRAIDLHEQVSAHFGDAPAFRSDLADDYNNLGALLRDEKEFAKAEEAYRQAIALGEQVTAKAPLVPQYQINLAASYQNLGNTVRDQRDPRAALAWYGKAIELLAPIDPRPDDAKRFLRNAYWDRANAFGQLGQFRDASQDWQRAIALEETIDLKGLQFFLATAQTEVELKAQNKPAGEFLSKAAAVHARAAAAAEATGEPGLQKQYADRALDLLEKAKTAGWFRDPLRIKQLKEDNAFASLPGDDFKRFLEGLEVEKGTNDRPEKK
ncbi:MAG TPA: serine/threonine-protein kinase [Gemmataceae bacterium]|nr:serine/threonine-protein kinase [Gemmataceae bacterium]